MDRAAAIMSIGAIVLHTIHVLLKDVVAIKEAPEEVNTLAERLQRLEDLFSSLESDSRASSLQRLAPDTQAQLERCFISCKDDCFAFHQKLGDLTKRSANGALHWVDRLSVGVFKQRHLQYLLQRLEACENTITASTHLATLSVATRSAEISRANQRTLEILEEQVPRYVGDLTNKMDELQEIIRRSQVTVFVPGGERMTDSENSDAVEEITRTLNQLDLHREALQNIHEHVQSIRAGDSITNSEASDSLIGSFNLVMTPNGGLYIDKVKATDGAIVGRASGVDFKDFFSRSRNPS
ncbi:hypothetical protein DM02DRAFT_623190 [Periconia macrospinosa]|uniref:Azaphilone pigments biosynthesis cluster protein L N-terminal domain-containing protein n=1 Tax=Periconia macrospinosa TaxID=97972 RepID=A0A2V1E6T1_9PLEO|nr:hypothetical protein DM02DRAFT_623190 [Periconia macrospinosa]